MPKSLAKPAPLTLEADPRAEIHISPARLQAIDHTTRNTAGALRDLTHLLTPLPGVTDELKRVSDALSGERRAIAGDRANQATLASDVKRIEHKFDAQHEKVVDEVRELRDWIKYGLGAAGAGAMFFGWLIASHRI